MRARYSLSVIAGRKVVVRVPSSAMSIRSVYYPTFSSTLLAFSCLRAMLSVGP